MSERPPELQPVPDPVRTPDVMGEPDPAAFDDVGFADLTLWDVLGRGLQAPRETWHRFWEAVNTHSLPAGEPMQPDGDAVVEAQTGGQVASVQRKAPVVPAINAATAVPFLLMAAGVVLGLAGSLMMASGTNRSETRQLYAGAPWLLAGFGLWLAAGIVLYRDDLAAWWARRGQARLTSTDSRPAVQRPPSRTWLERYAARLPLVAGGIVLSAAAYLLNGGNRFTPVGVLAWVGSLIVWLAALAPDDVTLRGWFKMQWARLRKVFSRELRIRLSWTALALLLVVAVGAYFRFNALPSVPPEMTSDHVEKLLDAQRVLDGNPQVFFPNNGGREPLQMYLVAVFSVISGLGMQFSTLKWVSILEGLVTLPVLWWMAREIIGEEQPRLGNVVGLLLAALVAVSYWHVALSRLALRIVLTPLVMTLVMIFLARAMRHNRRADFLKAGVVLGIGVYCYQAVRMIPVVVVLGIALAIFTRARNGRERRRYVFNLAALVVISVVIFVPLGRFMLESPNLFWMRTAGRFFGDDVIMEVDPVTGVITERDATMEDRLNAFAENLPVLGQNIRNVLLMFNWKGDVAWINGAPNEPAMDPVTGTFLILGTAAWGIRMIRRRDVVDWLILPAAFVMLMPSALSIAFPVENPSATRTSGALPFVYLLAAYGMAMLFVLLQRTWQRRGAVVLSTALAVGFIGIAYAQNSGLYLGEYHDRYTIAAQPYAQAGRILRGFAESNGSYGNAFMVAYPYWFDHRAIGIEGGRIDWPNGLVTLGSFSEVLQANIGTGYAFDPERSVLFFYNANDTETFEQLREWFPDGNSLLQTTDMAVKDFYTYIAPPPGEAWLADFLAASPIS